MNEHYKYELKLKKRFPFVYILKRKENTVERIHRQYNEVVDVLIVGHVIGRLGRVIVKLKSCICR